MDFVLSMLMKTAVIPIGVAVFVTGLLQRFDRWQHTATTLGVACGFIAGWMSQDWTVWVPERYLDWMPVAAILLVFFPYFAALPAAWLLVPAFASLQPPRSIAIVVIAAVTYAGLLFEKVRTAPNQRLLIAVLMATGTTCSVVLAQSYSLKFAQIAGLLAAALTPGLVWTHAPRGNTTGLPVLFYGLMSNLMFIGYANTSSDVPAFCFGVPLLAPALLLWNPTSKRQKNARLTAIAAILAIALVPAILAHPPWEVEL